MVRHLLVNTSRRGGAAGIGMVWWLVAGKTREPRLLCDGKAAPPLVAAPHDSAEERRAVYSVPRMGWQGNTIRKGAKRPENRVARFPVEKVRRSRIRGATGGGQFSRMFSTIYAAERKSRNAGPFHRKELPDRAEDRSLLCKGAAERRHFTEESFRPLRGLGFLRGALILRLNQRAPLTKIRYPPPSGDTVGH